MMYSLTAYQSKEIKSNLLDSAFEVNQAQVEVKELIAMLSKTVDFLTEKIGLRKFLEKAYSGGEGNPADEDDGEDNSLNGNIMKCHQFLRHNVIQRVN